ncbi:hypothetical protein BCR44DRAFT_1461002 [Catenaria anguillulae PL171]|uniref:protein kinase C n=1 Tax=Catenaria anguillulae PL171 TaxID=765915 RepID=A0A1Y2HM77_9FUNG|nr:hypothetical protein BCR44DRAFT_1461002 [Catenaria anguillulae PL171]
MVHTCHVPIGRPPLPAIADDGSLSWRKQQDGQDQEQTPPPPPPPPPPKDSRSAEILRKLGVEEKMREGALLMRAKLTDRNALAQCEASLAESAKRIAYLRQQLERLSIGSSAGGGSSTHQTDSTSHAPMANNVALAVPVATATAAQLGSSPSSDSLALTVSSSATSLSGLSPSTSVGQLSSASLPTVHVQTSASSAANSTKESSSSGGGFFSYLKKSMRSKSSSSVNALDPSTSSGPGSDAAGAGGPASDPRVALAHQLPDTELGKLFLSGPPPMGSLPPLPDLEPSTNDTVKEQQPTASNLAASRTGAMLSTQVISSKMRDLTYKLDLATKAVASTSRAGGADGTSSSTSSSPPSSSGTTSPTQGMSKHASSVSLRHGGGGAGDNTATLAQHHEALVRLDALKRALNKYSGLYVPEGVSTTEDSQAPLPPSTHQVTVPAPPPMVTTLPRRQQLGDLTVHVVAARVPPSVKNALSRSRADHYVALVQVDGVVKARSRAFKAPKDKTGCETEIPFNEQVVVTGLDKNAEVEVVLVEADKQGSVKMVDGLVWFRVADVADSLLGEGVRGVQGWFDLDPVGAVLVRATVTPVAARARKVSRLGRQGAVRKKKKVEATRNGHQFVLAQYATIVKCALCSEFIGVSACYACESCGFSCHKKCAPKVLTRCFGSADDEDRAVADEDGEPLPHNIPHRFTPTTNLKAHWCCHCGHLVPLGRGNVKCSECDLMAHKGCALLVPNFCGLSMKRANKMLHEIKLAKDMRAANAIRVAQRQAAILPPQPVAVPELPKPVPPPSEPVAIVSRQAEPAMPAPVSASLAGKAILDRTVGGAAPAPATAPTTPYPSPPKLVSLDDFSFLAVLGKGNFGKVMLAEERTSRKLYAIKVLKKDFVLENDEVESTRSEKRIFQAANSSRHPFLVNLYATLQTESRLYFVMEYVAGGDLMWHIQREQFNERRARFYACEVLLALQFFHQNSIVYRDLKLDNIMLGMDGHIKLADYGLCKENMPLGATTNTFCGTPEFMAPEILCEQHYGRAVDWWAFGVLVYEMLCGQSPFRGDDEEEIFEAILHDEVLYPITMSRDAVHLCQGLLTKDPRKRLGAGALDADEIKRHPFFKGVDWDALLAKRIPPPFVPRITNAVDVSNFDEEFTREPPVLTPIHTTLDEADQMEFAGFSYVAEWVNEAVSVGGATSMTSRYGGR